MAPGRLSVARAEIASLQDRWQVAEEAAIQAIEIARAIGREKYETSARIVLGSALLEQGPRRPTVSVILRRDGVRSLRWPVRWTPLAMTAAQPTRARTRSRASRRSLQA